MLVVIVVISLIALTIAIFALPHLIFSKNKLPQPSGKWQVGTTDIDWDAPNYPSGIIAKVWYPTEEKSGINSPYIDRIDRRFADGIVVNIIYNLIFLLLRRISATPAFINAAPIQTPGGLPVLLFSPGFGGINYLGTFYALEFASHGFMVIGIDHPVSNIGSTCMDGSQIKFEIYNSAIFKDAAKLERYMGNIMQEQAKNMSIILDRILDLNSIPDSLLYQKIDRERIFAAGHSIGGAASFIACGKDRRISKGIDLDGTFIDLEFDSAEYTDKELLLIQSDREKYKPKDKKSLEQYSAITANEKMWIDRLSTHANLEKIVFESTTHASFTDLAIFINPSIGKKLVLLGDLEGMKLLRETSMTMINFLNK
jgi:Platelet-activating factor acetylhydrolase, isoform II